MIKKTMNLPKVIAHRGASAYAPENTLTALRLANEFGATWVEFDVMLTDDGEAIIIHDETLNRTTNGHGRVSSKTYADISRLDAGSWFDHQFAGERVPSFVEFMQCLSAFRMGMNLEIKPSLGKEEATAQKIMTLLHNHWPIDLPRPLISSRDMVSLETVREMDPEIPIGYITDKLPKGWERIIDFLDCSSIHLKQNRLDAKQIKRIKQTHRYVLAYTVNDPGRAKDLFSWGIDAIFSDYPDLLTPS